jgi:diguanylate cyclase (GGDEF)-like protein
MSDPLVVLLVGMPPARLHASFAASPFGPYALEQADDVERARAALAERKVDAVLLDGELEGAAAFCAAVGSPSTIASAAALCIVVPQLAAGELAEWLGRGAQDVLATADVAKENVARRLRAAIERKRLADRQRTTWATDLATGLPHRGQFVEHLSQLLALREREPAPMAVVALRVEGFATTQSRLGAQAADALRRKIAVRLRAAVRASDVVAALDDSSYAVLLGAVLAPADGPRVAAKLAQLLMEPFSVGGVGIAVAVATGVGAYPEDGNQPDALLRKAIGAALDQPAQGRVGMANFLESGARPLDAANDE